MKQNILVILIVVAMILTVVLMRDIVMAEASLNSPNVPYPAKVYSRDCNYYGYPDPGCITRSPEIIPTKTRIPLPTLEK